MPPFGQQMPEGGYMRPGGAMAGAPAAGLPAAPAPAPAPARMGRPDRDGRHQRLHQAAPPVPQRGERNSGNQPSGTTTAALGAEITLAGIADGEQVTVTAVRVINSATSSDTLFAPTSGHALLRGAVPAGQQR